MADAALISGLLSSLETLIKDEFSLFCSFKKEVQKLSSTLSSISAVLEDAERKNVQEKDKQTEDWLRKLKDVAYEVRDIMDDCTYEDLRLQVNKRNASSSTWIKVTNSLTHPFNTTLTHSKVGHKIKDVQEKLNQIYLERQMLHLRKSNHDSKIDKFDSSWRETMSLSSCNQVNGRDKEKKQIIDILVGTSSVDNKLSVLPIVGIGGLGKTTLAQMVFNDEEIAKHFETKIWVCVSDEFDIKLVIKAILEEKAEARLEELQKKVQDKLSGKRYLIVLDDVWNENVEEWNQLRSILDCGANGAFVLTTTRKRNVARIMETIQHFRLSLLSDYNCWLLFEERAFLCGKPKTQNFVDIGKEIARKCKGVPLVAKTLGSQLSFKCDVNEWCKIRDSEIWELFQNEESDLLHILKLSYYDLPYYLRRCFGLSAIFPKDTIIEKERLIQWWMAHDLIPTVQNQAIEDIGNTIWKELCWRSFFQDEKLDRYGIYETCKMHDLMHNLAQSVMKYEFYTLDTNSSSDDLRREIRHVTINVSKFNKTLVPSLKKIGGLQSIMINGVYGYENFKREILIVLKEVSNLRVLTIRDMRCQDLRYIQFLKHLRYLDISDSTHITTLPDSICDLLNIQTLKLNGCYKLKSLPRNIRDLINLRHLYLEGCNELKYMPKGMEQLKYLRTLSLFVIGKKERACQLDELKELDIHGLLKIRNLGRVNDASIARGVSMAKMSGIKKLELEWISYKKVDDNERNSTRHEKIGEALEVSSVRLKILKINGYKGVNLPKWVEKSSSLTYFVLGHIDNVNTIVSSNDGNEMMVPFPLLKELFVYGMKNLRELVSPNCGSSGAFPKLCRLDIYNCPNLGRLPPHLKELKNVTIEGRCSDELLYSISNLNGSLTKLQVDGLNNVVEHIFTINNMNGIEVVLFPLLEDLSIIEMKNLRELVSPTIPSPGAFPNLCRLHISNCPKLGALPPYLKSLKHVSVSGECSDEFLYSISNLSVLNHLSLYSIKERSVLFPDAKALMFDDEIPSSSQILGDNNNEEQLGVHSTFQSLQFLYIKYCDKLRRLSDEGMIIQDALKISGCQNQQNHHDHLQVQTVRTRGLINSLTHLFIENCPELMISVEEFGNLNINNSLQKLRIENCPKLVSSEEADDFIALLRSLRKRLGTKNFHVDIIKEFEKKKRK